MNQAGTSFLFPRQRNDFSNHRLASPDASSLGPKCGTAKTKSQLRVIHSPFDSSAHVFGLRHSRGDTHLKNPNTRTEIVCTGPSNNTGSPVYSRATERCGFRPAPSFCLCSAGLQTRPVGSSEGRSPASEIAPTW